MPDGLGEALYRIRQAAEDHGALLTIMWCAAHGWTATVSTSKAEWHSDYPDFDLVPVLDSARVKFEASRVDG